MANYQQGVKIKFCFAVLLALLFKELEDEHSITLHITSLSLPLNHLVCQVWLCRIQLPRTHLPSTGGQAHHPLHS